MDQSKNQIANAKPNLFFKAFVREMVKKGVDIFSDKNIVDKTYGTNKYGYIVNFLGSIKEQDKDIDNIKSQKMILMNLLII